MFLVGVERAQSLTERAVDVLECLLTDRKHPSVRLGAAHHILEFAHLDTKVMMLPGGQSAYATSLYSLKARMGERAIDSKVWEAPPHERRRRGVAHPSFAHVEPTSSTARAVGDRTRPILALSARTSMCAGDCRGRWRKSTTH